MNAFPGILDTKKSEFGLSNVVLIGWINEATIEVSKKIKLAPIEPSQTKELWKLTV